MKIGCVVMAAGRSRRFGANKLLPMRLPRGARTSPSSATRASPPCAGRAAYSPCAIPEGRRAKPSGAARNGWREPSTAPVSDDEVHRRPEGRQSRPASRLCFSPAALSESAKCRRRVHRGARIRLAEALSGVEMMDAHGKALSEIEKSS